MKNMMGKCCSNVKWAAALFVIAACCSAVDTAWAYTAAEFSSMPINIVEEGAKPRVMIAASKDHQLFYKAYNDYSDLDGDGQPETTYKHSFDYYGYFDSYKCYTYSTANNRFEPQSFTTTKYCNNTATTKDTGFWSGNFLNWVSMSRIDTIRKILFGGHRRFDTATDTTLERSYLPHDAHSWAKYYDGGDISQLTPFKQGTNYDCDKDTLTAVACQTGGVLDLKKVGITFGNTTDVNTGNYGSNIGSEKYTEPPLIKVVKGNYSLWASNERWQCLWHSGSAVENENVKTETPNVTNSNDPSKSFINAYSNSPSWATTSPGTNYQGEYVARVQACVAGKIDDAGVAAVVGSTKEKCKRYPDGNYKPIGLLQTYGDDDKMYFGMVAGSYQKHAAGGDLIRNSGSFTDEVNVTTNGTFRQVSTFAVGPTPANISSIADGAGLVNAWSLYRIIRYDAKKGYYNDLDSCSWGLSALADTAANGKCQNWGNPFAEIYYQAINYVAGGGVIGDYRSNSSTGIPGLPTPPNFVDPIGSTSYCARLSVVAFNSSTISYDYNQLDDNSYGVQKLWDPAVLPGNKTSAAMTNKVGELEGINNHDYFIGEVNIGGGTDNQLCTSKTITGLGLAGGLCPEAPRLSGSYRIAGLAYYAHTQDIRPDLYNSRKLPSMQVVDSYAVSMATGAPILEIPDPENINNPSLVTILPACRNTSLSPAGNCTLVDFKIISRVIDPGAKTVTGKVYINWEDSEQGGDYDQDMWGVLSYTLNKTAGTIAITTQVHEKSTPYLMGFGYVLSGAGSSDGFHAHSGINDYKNTITLPANSECSGGGCNSADAATTKTYTLGTSTTKLLKDPLWYAAKYGGFTDSNQPVGAQAPDLVDEWDSKINTTGAAGHDGIPDNYFYASNPRQLEDSLDRIFKAILERTSSGTAAAVVSNNVRGEGALYQAYYEPLKKDPTAEARWTGTVQALWLDSYGLTRQDCTAPANGGIDVLTGKCLPPPQNYANGVSCVPDHKLDNYCVDQVVETYYDASAKRTRTKIFESDDPGTYTAYSMQGVVKTFTSGTTSGTVKMVPNSMEGTLTVAAGAPEALTITPYIMKGTVTAYDSVTGAAQIKITEWNGRIGQAYAPWEISDSASAGAGYSTDLLTPVVGNFYSFMVPPSVPDWIIVGDTLTFKTKNMVGASGQTFSGGWVVECLDNSSIKGEVTDATLQLNNASVDTFVIDPVTPDFTGCTKNVKVSTFNLKGTAGKSYSKWTVSNLDVLAGKGDSADTILLANSGEKTFTVTPGVAWLSPGNAILVSNLSFQTKELYELGYLWNAKEELYLPLLSNTTLETNRTWLTDKASAGRYIYTWVDANLNGVVDAGEYRPFQKDMIGSGSSKVSHTVLNASNATAAQNVVDYVRGIEVTGTRNRTILDKKANANRVMRLGDVVNSTPAVVAAPQEGFDLLYSDNTYREFHQKFADRRIMVYAGGNDGLIHAFNGGFYNKVVENKGTASEKTYIEYSTKGKKLNGTDALEHPLGSEIWAFAPYNLLSHLQWLKDPDYGKTTHVYYMDGKPRIFDAKIFPSDATEHPSGWGTVMVIGMNLGGGQMNISVDEDNNAGTAQKTAYKRSVYVVFDVTNPEAEPRFLGEIPIPDGSFSTVYPAIVAFQNATDNDWYLMFGNGPNDMTSYTTNQSAHVYLFNISQLLTSTPAPAIATTTPSNCTVKVLNANNALHVLDCNTLQANSFMGTPAVVDWDLDFKADTAYFGIAGGGGSNPDTGMVMRFGFNNQKDISKWDTINQFYNTGKPVVGQPTPSFDNLGTRWLFFGTGRYFSAHDKTTTDTHYLYGVKDAKDETSITHPVTLATTYLVNPALMLDVSGVEVYADSAGTVATGTGPTYVGSGASAGLTTFSLIEKKIDESTTPGWRMRLEPIVGTDFTVPYSEPTTRNFTRSPLLGGVLFSSVFQPSSDICAGEGQSRLFGLYYKTGTANSSKTVFGSRAELVAGNVKYRAVKFLDLGQGVATTPALHSGKGSGSGAVKIITQLSTGEMVEVEAELINKIRSGRTSWRER